MDFELSEDERSLAEGVRKLCTGRFPLERLRAGEERHTVDRDGWRQLADAGVFALTVPADDGGVGLGLAQAALVFEELGRALVPGPLADTQAAAAFLEEAASGDAVVGVVRRDRASSGLPIMVSDCASLDALMVVDDDAGISVIDRPASLVTRQVERPLDPLTPLSVLSQLPAGRLVADADRARQVWRDLLVIRAAYLVGLAAACTDMAVEYAQQREQFGRAIGSFQAVKHLCADMLVRAETARTAVQAAAVTVDQPDVGDPWRASAGAALLAAEAALANGKSCIQVHGGMGFTWEVPAHLYLMRARVVAQSLSPVAELAEYVAESF